MEDEYHLDDAAPGARRSIWSHPHFCDGGGGAVPLRRRAGRDLQLLHQLHDVGGAADARVVAGARWFRIPVASAAGSRRIRVARSAFSNKGAANLASLGFLCFLVGRFTGAGLLKKFAAHKVLGLYGGGERCRSAC